MAKISQKLRNFLKEPYNLDVDKVIAYLLMDEDGFNGKDTKKDMQKIFAEASKYRGQAGAETATIACLVLEHAIKAYKPDEQELREIGQDLMEDTSMWR